MAKVMLINPPQRCIKGSGTFDVYFPTGLLYIAAMVKSICDVKIYDSLVTDFEVRKEEKFTYYGAPYEKIKDAIESFKPDIVGITCPFLAQIESAKSISKLCKEIDSKITVVFGGAEASVKYRSLLDEDICDYVVMGEGEKTFFEFVRSYFTSAQLKDIGGVASKTDGRIEFRPRKYIENLDEIPFPAYDLIRVGDYLKHPYLYRRRSRIPKNSITMITSRGCPFNCVFCAIKLHMGSRYRAHSADYVLNHLKYCIDKLGISGFHFEDDNFSFNKARFIEILDRIVDDKLKIRWDTPNGIRVDSLDSKVLKKMKKSGCFEIMLSIESGSQHVLSHIIKKGTNLDYIKEIVRECKKVGIKMGAFFVIGFPGETKDNIKDTLNLSLGLLKGYDVLPAILYAEPLLGTELYDICLKEKFISAEIATEDSWAGNNMIFGEPWFSTHDFTKDELKSMVGEFLPKLTRELVKYSLRHPFQSLRQAVATPQIAKKFVSFFKNS